MGVFTFLSIVGAAIAVIMKENAKQLYITCGVLFSAGVLLAAGFVHLLVDSNEQFTEMAIDNFLWAFSISGVTIVCLMCFEIVLDRVIDNYMNKKAEKDDDGNDGVVDVASESTRATPTPNGHTPPSKHDEIVPQEVERQQAGATGLGHDHLHPVHPGSTPQSDHDHMHSVVNPNDPFTAILLTVALSIHSVIEGLGLGASADISDIESAFVAIAVHKFFTSFALAQGMVSSGFWEKGSRKYFYLSIGTFIFVALLGIAIGWAVSPDEENTLTAVLISITSGSFIYVALLELLPQETKQIKHDRLPVLPVTVFFLAGYLLMSMLAIWV